MPELRKLNENGMKEFQDFLISVADSPEGTLPHNFLTSPQTSEGLPIQVQIEPREFGSRMAAAEYFFGAFSQAGASGLERTPEMWSWLSCFYFEELCPKRKDGSRKPGEQARWIPSGHAFRYYRHLLAGPYFIYKSFREAPERAGIVLCGGLDSPGDFVEQLASRQDFVQNKAVIDAATVLYLNPESGRPKRGTSPTQRKPGTLRRFVDIVNQFDPAWDLYSMGTNELINKLPQEFQAYI